MADPCQDINFLHLVICSSKLIQTILVSGIPQYNELLLYENQTYKVNVEGCLNFGLSCTEALSKVRNDGTNQTIPSVFSCMYHSDQKVAISQYVSPEDTRTFFIIMSTILLETFVVSLFLMLAASKMWKVSNFYSKSSIIGMTGSRKTSG